MSFACADLEPVLREADPGWLAEARSHAARCPACAGELRLWDAVSACAPALHREWQSPELWPRIEAALAAEAARPRAPAVPRWLSLAAVLLLFVAAAFLALRPRAPVAVAEREDLERRLLTEQAVAAVERSEADYIRSIDELARVARPLVEAPRSPLSANYREKLLLLDSAIASCRSEIARNRFNAHLRRELLSIYHEKQQTLEQLVKEDKHAL